MDSWGMYERSVLGLFKCYLAALPFLRLSLISNLVFLPLSIITFETLSWLFFKILIKNKGGIVIDKSQINLPGLAE